MTSTVIAVPTPLQVRQAQLRARRASMQHHPAFEAQQQRAAVMREVDMELAWAVHEAEQAQIMTAAPDSPSGTLFFARPLS